MVPSRHRPILALAASGLCAAILVGCHATVTPLANERLDRTTGTTLLTADEPMVFARTEGRYSRSARDYVYLGPIETNRQGSRDYYLWVGVGTTLDRGYLAPDGEVPEAIFVNVQGELMEFKLKPWSQRAPSLGATPLYSTAVDVDTQLAARVTLHQLALLSSEALESVRVADADGKTRLYRRWQGVEGWHGFLQQTLTPEPVAIGQTRTR